MFLLTENYRSSTIQNPEHCVKKEGCQTLLNLSKTFWHPPFLQRSNLLNKDFKNWHNISKYYFHFILHLHYSININKRIEGCGWRRYLLTELICPIAIDSHGWAWGVLIFLFYLKDILIILQGKKRDPIELWV